MKVYRLSGRCDHRCSQIPSTKELAPDWEHVAGIVYLRRDAERQTKGSVAVGLLHNPSTGERMLTAFAESSWSCPKFERN